MPLDDFAEALVRSLAPRLPCCTAAAPDPPAPPPPQRVAEETAASGWFGTRTSSITRFLEAAHGSQRSFKQGEAGGAACGRARVFKRAASADLKGRYLRYGGIVLRFMLLWREKRSEHETDEVKYW